MFANELINYIKNGKASSDVKNQIIEKTFNIWSKATDWNAFSTFFYAIDVSSLSKDLALFILKTAHTHKSNIAFYNSFIDLCIDEFGDSQAFKIYRNKVIMGPSAGW